MSNLPQNTQNTQMACAMKGFPLKVLWILWILWETEYIYAGKTKSF